MAVTKPASDGHPSVPLLVPSLCGTTSEVFLLCGASLYVTHWEQLSTWEEEREDPLVSMTVLSPSYHLFIS